ncbi:U3 snoRNP-associated protein-like YAOH [Diplonema papillatum]|nr:U3 snoRNP-associated protein-like YAOH [Diplonema papillatum]
MLAHNLFLTSAPPWKETLEEAARRVLDRPAVPVQGSLRLFDTRKRRPICKVATVHGIGFAGGGSGLERIMSQEEIEAGTGSLAPGQPQHPNWIMALAAVPYSDLVVSGGLGGSIHFWRVSGDNEVDFVANPEALTDNPLTSLHLLHTIPVDGIVNSLYLPRSAQCVIATVSREPRLGRWFTSNGSRNHILVIPLTTKQMPRSVPASLAPGQPQHPKQRTEGIPRAATSEHVERTCGEIMRVYPYTTRHTNTPWKKVLVKNNWGKRRTQFVMRKPPNSCNTSPSSCRTAVPYLRFRSHRQFVVVFRFFSPLSASVVLNRGGQSEQSLFCLCGKRSPGLLDGSPSSAK